MKDGKYAAPVVVDYGSLVELTAGQSTGQYLDKTFTQGTFIGDLTFSNHH